MLQSRSELRSVHVAALTIAPSALYLITRVARAPWTQGPEHVDGLGIAAVALQLAAAGALLWPVGRPLWQPASAIGVGLLIGVSGYAGAIAVESVPWLGETASLHGAHAHDDHGDHAAHDGHDAFGVRGMSLVGTVPYYGPESVAAMQTACRDGTGANLTCYIAFLQGMLVARGSVAAFDFAVDLMDVDTAARSGGHNMAHSLGHFAFQVHGYDIKETLANCSYEIFQGCLHGALQAHFSDVASTGGTVDQDDVRDLCDGATNQFETYACVHGVGHGVTLYTNYDRDESLRLCDGLPNRFGRESCYGGVFMENVVGYFGSLQPLQAHHGHQIHDEPPTYWVDPADLAYPCNAVDDAHGAACWGMQTSLILHFNGRSFAGASAICDDQTTFRLNCFRSVGRDAAAHSQYAAPAMARNCIGEGDDLSACVKGFSAGVVLHHSDPEPGMALCAAVASKTQVACYEEVGRQALRMRSDDQVRTLCQQGGDFESACLAGAKL